MLAQKGLDSKNSNSTKTWSHSSKPSSRTCRKTFMRIFRVLLLSSFALFIPIFKRERAGKRILARKLIWFFYSLLIIFFKQNSRSSTLIICRPSKGLVAVRLSFLQKKRNSFFDLYFIIISLESTQPIWTSSNERVANMYDRSSAFHVLLAHF